MSASVGHKNSRLTKRSTLSPEWYSFVMYRHTHHDNKLYTGIKMRTDTPLIRSLSPQCQMSPAFGSRPYIASAAPSTQLKVELFLRGIVASLILLARSPLPSHLLPRCPSVVWWHRRGQALVGPPWVGRIKHENEIDFVDVHILILLAALLYLSGWQAAQVLSS